MTSYANYIEDFPTRCLEILDVAFEQAKLANREVTLMLLVASAAFIVPLERLRRQPGKHPGNDVVRYPKAKKKFEEVENKSFLNYWGQDETWELIELIPGEDVRNRQVDAWAHPDKRHPLSNDKKANFMFSHLRNALAHGGIFTYPNFSNADADPQIEEIVFVSQSTEEQEIERYGKKIRRRVFIDKYDVLLVSPQDFLVFLRKWIEFLKSLDLVTNSWSPV